MLRSILLVAMTMLVSPAIGQTFDEITGPGAVESMKNARRAAHSVTLDSSYASRLVGEAMAAVAALPPEYRQSFDAELRMLSDGLKAAVTAHGRGDYYKAVGDGGYPVVLARANAGNWLGVTDAANKVSSDYYKAYGLYSMAGSGYGNVASQARAVRRAAESVLQYISDYQSMLDAYEDFYGPIP